MTSWSANPGQPPHRWRNPSPPDPELQKTMVVKVISELKVVSGLKVFQETDPVLFLYSSANWLKLFKYILVVNI